MEDFSNLSQLSAEQQWTVTDDDHIQVQSSKPDTVKSGLSGVFGRLTSWVKGQTSLCQVFSVMTRSLDGVKVQNAKQAEGLMNLKNQVELQSNKYQKSTGGLTRFLDGILHGGRVSQQRHKVVGKAYEKLRANFFGEQQIVREDVPTENVADEERKIVDQTYRTLTSKHPTDSEFEALEDVIRLGTTEGKNSDQVLHDWYKVHAGQGYPAAQHRLAQLTEDSDKDLSSQLYHLAADAGVLGSQIRLADAYREGDKKLGIERNQSKAHTFMTKAQKDDRMFLGAMENQYYGGVRGVKKNPDAIEQIKRVHETTEDPSVHARAALTLAFDAHKAGNFQNAMNYANEAIEGGCNQAIPRLVASAKREGMIEEGLKVDGTEEQQQLFLAGVLYDEGFGVPKNPKIAEKLFEQAANLEEGGTGSLDALVELVPRKLNGKNYEVAAQLVEKLVERGKTEYRLPLNSLHNLGLTESQANIPTEIRYADVDEMLVMGQRWEAKDKVTSATFAYRRATKQGSARAAARLLHINDQGSKEGKHILTDQEIADFTKMHAEARQKILGELSDMADSADALTAYQMLQEVADLEMGEPLVSSDAMEAIADEVVHEEVLLAQTPEARQQQVKDVLTLLRSVHNVPTEQAKSQALNLGARLLFGAEKPTDDQLQVVEQALTTEVPEVAPEVTVETSWEGPQDAEQQSRLAYVDTVMGRIVSFVDEQAAKGNEEAVKGIFRISGSKTKTEELVASIPSRKPESINELVQLTNEDEVNLHASAMKFILAEMELIPPDQYEEWIAIGEKHGNDPSALREGLQEKIGSLDTDKQEMLTRILDWGQKFSQKEEVTKMGPSNLSIVWGPRLLKPPENFNQLTELQNQQIVGKIFTALLTPTVATDVAKDAAKVDVDAPIGGEDAA